jgi:hypothetical protein
MTLVAACVLQLTFQGVEAENEVQINRVFKGLDLYATAEGVEYEVVGFDRKRMLGTRDSKLYSMSLDSPVRYAYKSKMTTRWAEYDLVEMDPFYSRYIDDFDAWNTTVFQHDLEQDRYDVYASSHHRGGSRYSTVLTGDSSGAGSPSQARMESISKIETFDSLSFELENKLQNEGEYVDALRVKLTIKASHDISNAYLVALPHFTTPRDSIIKQRPFRKVLGDFKAKETRIFALQFFGFPQAFQMEAFELHLYSNGVEIPHQASPGLLVMTDQETFEYLGVPEKVV